MKPGKIDLDIYQGATFRKRLVWKLGSTIVDLTGYTAKLQIRQAIESASTLVELTTENGGIGITGAEGRIDLLIEAADTAALSFATAVYDLELINGTEVTRLCQGKVTLHKEVTR